MENIYMEIGWQVLLIGLTLLVMVIGLIGEIVPVIPGMVLIWIAALVYAIIDRFQHLSPWTILILILIWLLATGIDWVVTWLTAKHVGVSWWGLGFSILGTIIGTIFFNFWGMMIGMVAGAIVGEYIYNREVWKSMQAGGAMVAGWILGSVLKLMMAISMILIFLVGVAW
jgi:uncharacterized protein YqgC (DUF456 family)